MTGSRNGFAKTNGWGYFTFGHHPIAAQVITVNYAPGAVDAIHRHDAHAVVYVLDGEVEMQVRGGTLRRLGRGQVFYESPEDVHTVSRNASKTKPTKFVVFFIKNEGAPILTPIH